MNKNVDVYKVHPTILKVCKVMEDGTYEYKYESGVEEIKFEVEGRKYQLHKQHSCGVVFITLHRELGEKGVFGNTILKDIQLTEDEYSIIEVTAGKTLKDPSSRYFLEY